ncbi:hypothetical protein SNOG_06815 [Parastagonospora nodorum SN15]|uniref:Uncharacterized protein n=1 Tax=Phaeosphaeria nodorum (strain SN15 / ATCC MYA-4574 / FGSC 10173) TaxID=321614 RepID=Q0UN49_PHANO|nr:hypothetical protein SNOG_06815 [Parastagonospora nodorum SN15]EAT85466.1 hypothetical protein SNOG_06815 [Parastagonospora nodorum SN15]
MALQIIDNSVRLRKGQGAARLAASIRAGEAYMAPHPHITASCIGIDDSV